MTDKKHVARALPALPPRVDPQLRPLLAAIKEVLEVQVGHRGEDLDKAVTFRDLTEGGIANFRNRGIGSTLLPIINPGDQTTPPIPHSLVANGTFTNVLLSWGGGFKHDLVAATEVYRSTSDNLATASHIGSTSSFIYTDTVEPGSTNYYWVRFRSPAGVPSPYNATAGTVATTSKKVSDLISDLSDKLNESHLSTVLSTRLDSIELNGASITTEVSDRIAAINAEVSARSTGDGTLQGNIDTVSSTVSTQGTNITGNTNAVAALVVRVTDNEGDITTNATDITALESTVNSPTSGVAASASGLSTLNTTVATQGTDITAQASAITSLNTTVGGNSASIQSHTGSINGLSAEQYVKIDVNGNVSGYGIAANAGGSEFAVNADVFKIANGASKIVPFAVTGGATFINTALIQDASIDVAKIANLAVDFAAVTGTLTANQVSAGLITSNMVDAAGISADKIVMDGNIEFANTQSGVQFGKTSLGDSQAGAFFGRSGGVAGFNISSSTSGIYADSAGQVALNNVRLYTGSAGSAAEFPNPGTFTLNISSISTSISVIIIGGGGGSSNNASGTLGGGHSGSSGTASWLKWYSGLNGTGSVLATYTAAGGAGLSWGQVASNISSAGGAAGMPSSKAAGGAGGGGNGGAPSHGTFGSGGGGGGGTSGSGNRHNAPVTGRAAAGATVSQLLTKPSGAQSVKLFVGTGGAGGEGQSMHYNNNSGNWTGFSLVAGGNGGNGFVSVADPNSGGIEVDLLSIVNRLTAAGI